MRSEKYIEYLRGKSVETGEIDGHEFFIVPAPMESALNGYVLFKKKPVRENDYNGILSYVPVHGGITLCHHQKEGSVYGFDTLHYNSHEYPRTDHEWIKEQIKKGRSKGIKPIKNILTGESFPHAAAVLEKEPNLKRNYFWRQLRGERPNPTPYRYA